MEPLSPAAQARLEAFRRAQLPDDAVVDRCLAAIERQIAATEPIPPPAQGRRAAIGVAVAVAIAIAAGLALVIQGGTLLRGRDQDQASAAPHVVRPAGMEAAAGARSSPGEAPRSSAVIEPERADDSGEDPKLGPSPDTPVNSTAAAGPTPSPGAAADVDTRRDGAATADDAAAPPTSRTRPRPRADDLAAEVAMLREAKLAAPAARLEILAEMARRFPSGALAAERRLLEIEARCALGEVAAARALAKRLRDPDLAARAAALCPETPATPGAP